MKMLPTKEGLLSLSHKLPEEDNYLSHLKSTWVPQLTVIGIEGLPSDLSTASNTIKKSVTIRCSMRLPPNQTAEKALELLKRFLLENPRQAELTYGA